MESSGVGLDFLQQLAGQGPLVMALAGFMWWLMKRLQKADEVTRELQQSHIEIIKKLGSQIDRNTSALEKCEWLQARVASSPGVPVAPSTPQAVP